MILQSSWDDLLLTSILYENISVLFFFWVDLLYFILNFIVFMLYTWLFNFWEFSWIYWQIFFNQFLTETVESTCRKNVTGSNRILFRMKLGCLFLTLGFIRFEFWILDQNLTLFLCTPRTYDKFKCISFIDTINFKNYCFCKSV